MKNSSENCVIKKASVHEISVVFMGNDHATKELGQVKYTNFV